MLSRRRIVTTTRTLFGQSTRLASGTGSVEFLSRDESWRHRFLRVESLYSDMTVKFNQASSELKQVKDTLANTSKSLEKNQQHLAVWRAVGISTATLLSVRLFIDVLDSQRRDQLPDL
jgi:anti-sigma-K factor RskA